jgi:hypothetical protein
MRLEIMYARFATCEIISPNRLFRLYPEGHYADNLKPMFFLNHLISMDAGLYKRSTTLSDFYAHQLPLALHRLLNASHRSNNSQSSQN